MISMFNKKDEVVELRGLSTDTKPTNVGNGSVFIEIDTGTVYMFDAQNKQWNEV